jgi:hypothetical protein
MKMSSKDLHPELRYQAEIDGWSQGADVDPEAFAAYQQFKMALNSPQIRRATLNEVDKAIGREDGQTLRARSQLFDLRRKLSGVHERLLKVGR